MMDSFFIACSYDAYCMSRLHSFHVTHATPILQVGLGLAFLRHIERCRVIIHVINGDSEDPVGG